MAKSYQLVAWTQEGQVRMLPTLVEQFAQPFIERIRDIESRSPKCIFDQPRYYMALSRAYEALGRYYERFGQQIDAFKAYVNAATVVTNVDDIWWCDCDEGFILSKPFQGRFFVMYGKCRRLLQKCPDLKNTSVYDTLQHDYEMLSRVPDIWHADYDEGLATIRAWNFGRR